MRLFHALLLIPLLSAPALANDPSTSGSHGRRSAEQHFAEANTTHDGKLTMDQAAAGYKSIAKSFAQIDVNHHGYVTMDDIKAWKAAKKAAKAAAKRAAEGGEVQPPKRGGRADSGSADMIVPSTFGVPRTGVDLPATPLDHPRSS